MSIFGKQAPCLALMAEMGTQRQPLILVNHDLKEMQGRLERVASWVQRAQSQEGSGVGVQNGVGGPGREPHCKSSGALRRKRVWQPPNPDLFPGGSDGKESACKAGDSGSIPGLRRCPGEGNGYPLQYSCLKNPMDRGAWRATVHGVAKSRTRLSS